MISLLDNNITNLCFYDRVIWSFVGDHHIDPDFVVYFPDYLWVNVLVIFFVYVEDVRFHSLQEVFVVLIVVRSNADDPKDSLVLLD